MKVASMSVLLIDADEFTRSFYTSKSGDLLPPIELEQPVYPTVKSEIPPYNGFGSEEDSLQTCKPSLIPTAPMKDGQKMNLFQGMILRYKAKLHAPKESDKSREFIIQVALSLHNVWQHSACCLLLVVNMSLSWFACASVSNM